MTNSEFAKVAKIFREACKLGKVEPTARQASKFRNEKGTAYKFRNYRLILDLLEAKPSLQVRGEID